MQPRRTVLGAVVVFLAGCPATTVVAGGSTALGSDSGDGSGTDTITETGDGDGDDQVDDHRTFFIGESTKFDGGGKCDDMNLIAVTSKLRDELIDAGWTGQRRVDDFSWPEHYFDTTVSDAGLDHVYGDASRLVVYAGHGNVGQLQWGRPSINGECRSIINRDSRFGRFAG